MKSRVIPTLTLNPSFDLAQDRSPAQGEGSVMFAFGEVIERA